MQLRDLKGPVVLGAVSVAALASILALGLAGRHSKVQSDAVTTVPSGCERLGERHWRIPSVAKAGYFSSYGKPNDDIQLKPTTAGDPEVISELRIAKITSGCPMHIAGFRVNDRIVKVNDKPVVTMRRAINLSHEIQASRKVTVLVERDGSLLDFQFDFE